MNIKKADLIIGQVNETVKAWPFYAEKTGVTHDLTNAIKNTLLAS